MQVHTMLSICVNLTRVGLIASVAEQLMWLANITKYVNVAIGIAHRLDVALG